MVTLDVELREMYYCNGLARAACELMATRKETASDCPVEGLSAVLHLRRPLQRGRALAQVIGSTPSISGLAETLTSRCQTVWTTVG